MFRCTEYRHGRVAFAGGRFKFLSKITVVYLGFYQVCHILKCFIQVELSIFLYANVNQV